MLRSTSKSRGGSSDRKIQENISSRWRSVYPKKHNFLHNWRFPFLPSVSGNTVEGAEATAICNGEDAWWDCNGAAGAELYYGSQFIARANGCGTCNWWR